MYTFLLRWYKDYINFLKYPDGELREQNAESDFSDVSTDDKMKYY